MHSHQCRCGTLGTNDGADNVPAAIAPTIDAATLLAIIEHQTRTIEAHAATIRELCNRLAEASR